MSETETTHASSPTGTVVLGLWPIAGMTTIGVTARDVEATIETAIELGIRVFDTAYSYGANGESDRFLARAISRSGTSLSRGELQVIGKVGQRWDDAGKRVVDGSPETLRRDAEKSRERLGIERFSLLMYHQVDPSVPLQESAHAFAEMKASGLADRIGICNASSVERALFASECDCEAIQCPLNMLQPDNLSGVIADAAAAHNEVYVYWTLMKGLLAGKITREHEFADGDSRPGYAIFQGAARERAHQVVDGLLELAKHHDRTVADLAVSWTLSQTGVTGALVGARRPEQVREVAGAKSLDAEKLQKVDRIVARASTTLGKKPSVDRLRSSKIAKTSCAGTTKMPRIG